MLPPRRLFRSRWTALLWAAGILWTAVEVAGTAPAPHRPMAPATAPAVARDATDTPVDANEVAALLG